MRRYRVKLGHADEIVRLAELELIPMLRARAGFVMCQIVVPGPQSIVSVITFEQRKMADAANDAALNWVAKRLESLIDGPPKVTVGDVHLWSVASSVAVGPVPACR